MDTLTIQYIIIAIVFIVAVYFVVKRLFPSKGKAGGCNKGCGCAVDQSKK
ncbi:FeoB-associated Cys-rich membrane protein [Sphingobacterium psychroaquaticum]|uniref:Uncharacterized protein n=1 Tax=Sphingobacterium psychroaquaticum TaxID=561061 RepID=A0A1X7JNG7_9SPHI|nr:FeoB-associated Cys-rich membrane protein [Sphingobacterium psychroaquaticum]QBQ40894.1 FeoB-associated Cys-rich membrane protein [Sphingobacterium psychroaquaticum]SMG29641.1 hypothetical protein SAMN05660862_1960 [Sphingobacterium psychroaquaticum]